MPGQGQDRPLGYLGGGLGFESLELVLFRNSECLEPEARGTAPLLDQCGDWDVNYRDIVSATVAKVERTCSSALQDVQERNCVATMSRGEINAPVRSSGAPLNQSGSTSFRQDSSPFFLP